MNLQTVVNAFTPLRIFYTATAIFCAGFIGICLYKFPNPEGEIIALCYGQMAAHGVELAGAVLMLALMLVVLLEALIIVGPAVGVSIYRAIKDERAKRAGFTLRTYRYEAKPPHVFIHTLLGEKEHETLYRLNKALEETATTKGCVLAMFKGSEMLETIYAGRHWATVSRPESGLLVSTYDADFRFTDEDDHTYFQAVEEVGNNWKEKAPSFAARLAKQVNEERSPLMIAARYAMSVLLVLLLPLLASAGIRDEIRKGTPEAATLVPTKEVTFCFGQHSLTRKQTGQKTALELLVREGVPFNDDASVGEYIGVIIDGKLYQAVHANTEGKKPAALASLPVDSAVQRKSLEDYDRNFVNGLHQISETGEKIGRTKMADWAISGLFVIAIIALLWAWVTRDETLFAAGGQTIFGHGLEGLNANAVRVFVCAMLLAGSVWIAVTWFYVKLNDDWATPLSMVFNSGNLMLLALGLMAFLIAKFTSWLAPNRRVSSYAPKAKVFTQHGNNPQLPSGGN